MAGRAHRILIPLAALIAVLPLLINGPSCGHDFDFHLLSWLEAATQFAHLHYPRWAYTPGWNAGEPRFLFYPPLSWSLGALLGLLLPWKLVPAAFLFVALTVSGFTGYRLARRYAGPQAATLGAVLYLANPYMLFTAYERTAYGELLAASWLPLLLGAALAPRLSVVSLALPIALLWLSNAPAGVMGCYALAVLVLSRLVISGEAERRWSIAGKAMAATLLGLGLSAFYLLPAALEQKNIQPGMATIKGMRIADNTLFHHMTPATDDTLAHDVVLHTASVVALLVLGCTLAGFVAMAKGDRRRLLSAGLLALVIAFLLTRFSLPIWAHGPELRFLQFPWRLTAIAGSILAVVAACAFDRLKLKTTFTVAASVGLAVVLIVPAWQIFRQPCDPEDTVEARVALYHSPSGTDPTDEYTPAAADNDALGHKSPPYWFGSPSDSCDQRVPAVAVSGQAPSHLALELPVPKLLILNRRDFPVWQVKVNGAIATSCGRDDGLIAVLVPAGHVVVDVSQRGSADETAGVVCSVLSAATLASLGLRRRLTRQTRREPFG